MHTQVAGLDSTAEAVKHQGQYGRMPTWRIGSITLAPAGQDQSKLNELAGTMRIHGAPRQESNLHGGKNNSIIQYKNVEGTNYH